MKELDYIRKKDIDTALSKEYRQYLSGHLMREQPYLKHVDEDIEIGISQYTEYTPDKPHVHPVATEHGYVLQGSLRIRLLNDYQKEYQFNAGDFFVVRPGIPYAAKNASNTKVLFLKFPAVNDKQLVPVSNELKKWLDSWD